MQEIFARIRAEHPVVHCITNYVTAGAVANMLLAAGASPVMADHVLEAEEAARVSRAEVFNLGTLGENALDAMLAAGKCAAGKHSPIVLDPVGVAAFSRRREAAGRLLKAVPVTAIRANASEVRALCAFFDLSAKTGVRETCAIDAAESERLSGDQLAVSAAQARALARMFDCIVVTTGAQDLISDSKKTWSVQNGSSMMAAITGSGCMLDGVLAAALACTDGSAEARFQAAVWAVAGFGICGELAQKKTQELGGGSSSFGVYLTDAMSGLTDETIEKMGRYRSEKNI